MPRVERWLPVPDWPGYEVSDRGGVRSVDRTLSDGRTAGGVELALVGDKDGYLYAMLSDGPRARRAHVARLVLLAHEGPPPSPGHEACHRNGRRADNRHANLRWGTRAENRRDRETHRRERAERAARRAARGSGGDGVTKVSESETSEIDGAPSCQEVTVSATDENGRSGRVEAVSVSRLLSLSEAHAAGLFGSLTMAGVRTARYREQSFPRPVGRLGSTQIYSRDALMKWWRTR